MEKNRGSRIIAIIALITAVTGLTLGFAAFSNTLNISSSANVNPDPDTFKILFSSHEGEVKTEKVVGKTPTDSDATAGEAEISNTGSTPVISGLTAEFIEPGTSVTYDFYVHNAGEYEGYLKSINFANVDGENNPKICTAVDPSNTTASLVSKACEDISLTVKVGDTTATGTETNLNQLLVRKNSTPVTVTINYADNGNRADGDFYVEFGDISFTYSSAP